MEFFPAIIIPAFNRDVSLKRLLDSVGFSHFKIPPKIIISLEGNRTDKVFEVAINFAKNNENVEIVQHDHRLGLRDHILECGDYSFKYGSVIILEDDLLVDKYFYEFAVESLNFYSKFEKISGISLYSPEFNEFANLPFRPIFNGHDVYLMQTPCSWGQAWSAKQWSCFREWYANANQFTILETISIPCIVKKWPESSWKKYFAAYMARKDLYFIYPYTSFTTNCSDSGGAHIAHGTDRFQVSLASQYRDVPVFKFCPLEKLFEYYYDSFMDPSGSILYNLLGIKKEKIGIDIYGIKSKKILIKKDYILTSKKLNKTIKKYPLCFRPVELNIQYPDKDISEPCLGLGKTVDLGHDKNNLTLKHYEYFINFNLKSRKIILLILKTLPVLVYNKIITHFKFNK
jgi:hypothetical protein